MLNITDLILNEVLVLLCGLRLSQVNLFAEAAAHALVDIAVRANRVICKEEEQVDHTHVRIRDPFLPHGLLLESINKVLKAISPLTLVVYALLGLEGLNHAPHIVLVRILVRIVANIAHKEVLGDLEVLI